MIILSDNEQFRKLRKLFTTETQIWGFRDENDFLSHFYPAPVSAYGLICPTVEHAFQVSMTNDISWREKISKAKSPKQAKYLSHLMPERPDKKEVQLNIMYILDYRKFANNSELSRRLCNTGDKLLIEGNVWHDNFWGDCRCYQCQHTEGLNWSGKILMKVRNKLCGI